MKYYSSTNYFCLILITLVLFLVRPVLAQQKNGPSCLQRPIVMGVYEFGQFYRDGNGLDKDVTEQLEARSGCKFKIQLMLRGEIWHQLQEGSMDMTLSAAATPERTVFAWAIPYLWVKNMMIINKDVDAHVQSTSEFIAAPNLRLGIARGYFPGTAYNDFIAQLRNLARIDETGDSDRLFAMFKAHRFQAMLAPQLVYDSYLEEGQYRVEDWAPNAPRDSSNLLISKKNFSQDEAKRWGEIMNAMISDGSLRGMLEKYVSPADATRLLAPGRGH
jgi:polar amino acid transport system substrate-binding protein